MKGAEVPLYKALMLSKVDRSELWQKVREAEKVNTKKEGFNSNREVKERHHRERVFEARITNPPSGFRLHRLHNHPISN
jgi:hypothetical protein